MKALAAAYYLVTNYWRRPLALVLYVLVYWGRMLLSLLLIANLSLFAFHVTKAGLATAAAAVAVASFNLGFGIRDVMPGPPPGKRR